MYEWHEGPWVKYADHLAKVEKLEAENKALQEKPERMQKPVSDEEYIKHCSLIWEQGEDTESFLFERDGVDALLAARSAETPADKAGA
jgi:hypothetical protein